MRGTYMHRQWQAAVPLLLLMAMVSFPAGLQAVEPPDAIVLNNPGDYFGNVTFDHLLHQEVGACFDCHHHTMGGGTEDPNCEECHSDSPASAATACRDCHEEQPYSASVLQNLAGERFRYHQDKPGLKGAVHRNCLGCHADMDGPVGCQDCHERTERGDAFYAGTLGDQ